MLFAHRVAKTVEELLVYQKALAAAHEISAFIERPAFRRDPDLSSQLNRASIRVVSDIAEGFEQKTDRAFARYLYDSKGGAREIRVQLEIALGRGYLTAGEKERFAGSYEEVSRMLSGLIDHLSKED